MMNEQVRIDPKTGKVMVHDGTNLPELGPFGYHIPIEGFEQNRVTLQPSELLTGAKLYINGQPAPKGKWGTVMLQDDAGGLHKASFKNPILVDPFPQVKVGDTLYEVAPPLKWYYAIVAILPLFLIFGGGLIGGMIGGLTGSLSIQIIRKDYEPLTKLLLVGLCYTVGIVLAIVLFLGVGFLLQP